MIEASKISNLFITKKQKEKFVSTTKCTPVDDRLKKLLIGTRITNKLLVTILHIDILSFEIVENILPFVFPNKVGMLSLSNVLHVCDCVFL